MRTETMAIALAVAVLAACGAAEPHVAQASERSLGTPGAHEHGVARMNVAVEAGVLQLELFVPGQSVYGFEGEARSEEQRRQRDAGRQRLLDELGSALTFAAQAGCRVTEVREGGASPGDEEPSAAHDHTDAHGHAHGHTHDASPERVDSLDHDHDHEHGAHSEVHVEAVIRCASSPAGTVMRLDLARVLPEVHAVDLQLVSETRQFGARVPAAGYELRL